MEKKEWVSFQGVRWRIYEITVTNLDHCCLYSAGCNFDRFGVLSIDCLIDGIDLSVFPVLFHISTLSIIVHIFRSSAASKKLFVVKKFSLLCYSVFLLRRMYRILFHIGSEILFPFSKSQLLLPLRRASRQHLRSAHPFEGSFGGITSRAFWFAGQVFKYSVVLYIVNAYAVDFFIVSVALLLGLHCVLLMLYACLPSL